MSYVISIVYPILQVNKEELRNQNIINVTQLRLEFRIIWIQILYVTHKVM